MDSNSMLLLGMVTVENPATHETHLLEVRVCIMKAIKRLGGFMKRNKFLFNMITVLFLSALFSGCGTSGDASSSGSATGAAALQGTWNSACNVSGGTSEYDQHVFSGTTYNKYRYIFTGNTTCTGTPNTTSNLDTGTFSVEGSDATVASSWDTDIVESSGTVFDLFYVSGLTLQEGQKTVAQDETTAANRPTTLNSEVFTQQ